MDATAEGSFAARFLVVDDDPLVCRLESRMLGNHGFQCTVASSAQEALDIVRRDDVDVVITDINMPGTDGIELARTIQREHPGIPVVVVTGSGDQQTVDDARDAGVAGYIRKPFRPQDLIHAVRRASASRACRPRRRVPLPGPSAPPRSPSPEPIHPAPAVSELNDLLAHAVARGASDLHLSVGNAPLVRIDGALTLLDALIPALALDDMTRLLGPLVPGRAAAADEAGESEVAYQLPTGQRVRVNVFRDSAGFAAALHLIPLRIPAPADIGLSSEVLQLCRLRRGLILVTGPTGSGTSTTVAAMLGHINATRTDHVITLEDPIEFVHESRRCLVHQREIHTHTSSFADALRSALHEDPDVLVVGEMRDLDTTRLALHAAATGTLVIATLHAATVAGAVDHLIDQFPAGEQAQVRVTLAESLVGVVAQTLCRRTTGGRVAAREVLIATPAIANVIRSGRTNQLPLLMQLGRHFGMATFDSALEDLVHSGSIASTHVASLSGLKR